MKPIDADELIEFIENRYEITWESDTYEGGIKDACVDILEKINGMPPAEPVNNIRIQEVDEDFESCDDCIHYDDSVDTCVLRNCIHAITDLKECYERNSPPPDPDGADQEPITVRDKLNSMTDDEFAEWLCHQIFPDYDEDDVINVMRYQSVRNFLKMDIEQAKEEGR